MDLFFRLAEDIRRKLFHISEEKEHELRPVLPSVIAFHTFVQRRKFMHRDLEAQEAIDFMEIFQYLEHDPQDILPVYQPLPTLPT